MKNAVEEESTHRVILELDVELYDELEAYCTDQGITIEECIVDWIESGLPDDPDTSNGDEDAREKQQRQAERDSNPSKSTSENDPDNFPERRKLTRHETPAEAHARRLENKAHHESLVCAGRFQDAADFAKVAIGCDKIEAQGNQPSVEQQRKSLVDSIVRHGSQLLRP